MSKNGRMMLNFIVSFCLALAGAVFSAYFFSRQEFQGHVVLQWLFPVLFAVAWALFAVFYCKGYEKTYKLFLTGFFLADLIAALLFFYQVSGLNQIIYDSESLRAWIESKGIWAPIVFIALQFLQTVILPIPTFMTIAAGVVCFGALWCTVYSYIGCVAGSVAAFLIGRKLGYAAVAWLLGKDTLDEWLRKVKRKDTYLLTAMFLLPFFPDDILCFVSGLSSMKFGYFVVMILISRLIAITTTAFPLKLIPFNTWWGILIWVLIFAVVIGFMVFLYKNSDRIHAWLRKRFSRHKKEKSEEKPKKDTP